jgi:hypothetical protein
MDLKSKTDGHEISEGYRYEPVGRGQSNDQRTE